MNNKVDIYFQLLHPEYDTLTPGEKYKIDSDRLFIEDNLDEIETMYRKACLNGKSPEEAIKGAVKLQKLRQYFDLLYPEAEQENMSEQEYAMALEDKRVIRDHLDEIDKMYTKYVSQAERQGEEIDKQEIIAAAVKIKKVVFVPYLYILTESY